MVIVEVLGFRRIGNLERVVRLVHCCKGGGQYSLGEHQGKASSQVGQGHHINGRGTGFCFRIWHLKRK